MAPVTVDSNSAKRETAAFYPSRADSLQTLLTPLALVYIVWLQYSRGNYLLAGLFLVIVIAIVLAAWRQSNVALFTFNGDTLEVREVFRRKLDIALTDIHAIDESPWIGIKVHANFTPYRLLVNRLDTDDRRTFMRILRQRTGLV